MTLLLYKCGQLRDVGFFCVEQPPEGAFPEALCHPKTYKAKIGGSGICSAVLRVAPEPGDTWRRYLVKVGNWEMKYLVNKMDLSEVTFDDELFRILS